MYPGRSACVPGRGPRPRPAPSAGGPRGVAGVDGVCCGPARQLAEGFGGREFVELAEEAVVSVVGGPQGLKEGCRAFPLSDERDAPPIGVGGLMNGAVQKTDSDELAAVEPVQDRLDVVDVLLGKVALGPTGSDVGPCVFGRPGREAGERDRCQLLPFVVQLVVGDVVKGGASGEDGALNLLGEVRGSKDDDGHQKRLNPREKLGAGDDGGRVRGLR